jgi:hypothetical protein
VTFSDPKVAALVNERFVAAWFNRGPGFHNEDYGTERWIFEADGEAYPTKNICTFFLSPEGRVFHYVAGYWAPELFLPELETALRLRREGFDGRMRLRREGMESMRRIHRERAAAAKEPVRVGERRIYRGFEHRHTEGCAARLAESRAYLERLHLHWAERLRLPALEEVRFDYLYGNPFTEEPREGAMRLP